MTNIIYINSVKSLKFYFSQMKIYIISHTLASNDFDIKLNKNEYILNNIHFKVHIINLYCIFVQ